MKGGGGVLNEVYLVISVSFSIRSSTMWWCVRSSCYRRNQMIFCHCHGCGKTLLVKMGGGGGMGFSSCVCFVTVGQKAFSCYLLFVLFTRNIKILVTCWLANNNSKMFSPDGPTVWSVNWKVRFTLECFSQSVGTSRERDSLEGQWTLASFCLTSCSRCAFILVPDGLSQWWGAFSAPVVHFISKHETEG